MAGGGEFPVRWKRRLRRPNKHGARGRGRGVHRGEGEVVSGLGGVLSAANSATAIGGSEEGKNVGAALRGFSGRVRWRGGRGRHGGARGLLEGTRGRRWPGWCSSAAAIVLGFGRERERDELGERVRSRERRGKREGAWGGVVGSLGGPRSRRWRRGSRARATPRLCLLAEEDDERRGGLRWWAGPPAGPAMGGGKAGPVRGAR